MMMIVPQNGACVFICKGPDYGQVLPAATRSTNDSPGQQRLKKHLTRFGVADLGTLAVHSDGKRQQSG